MAGELDSWTVVEAKARFAELLERASRCGPQAVSRHGRPYAVVASTADFALVNGRWGGRRRPVLSVLLRTEERFCIDDAFLAQMFPRLAPPPAADAQGAASGRA